MANGYANNHTSTVTGNGHANSDSDAKPTAGTENMEDTVEFRLMMTYAQRRRPGDVRLSVGGGPSARQEGADTNGTGAPKTRGETDKEKGGKKKKKKKKKKGLTERLRFCSCVRAQREEGEGEEERGEPESGGRLRTMDLAYDVISPDVVGVEEVVCRLTKIADGVEFTPSDIESDGQEDDVDKLIGLLLRESGDRLNEEVLKDASLARELFGNYSFFERLMSAFLGRMGLATSNPEAPGSQGSPKTQIALTCEVTSRLSAVGTHPMTRLMGFGAKYLQDHYSIWAAQQGGYEEAFESEDDDEVH